MRLKHFKRLALVLGIQWVLCAAVIRFDGSVNWLAGVATLLAFLGPFAGNIWAIYDAPLGAKASRVVKTGVTALIAFGLTVAGLAAGLITFAICGFPVRGTWVWRGPTIRLLATPVPRFCRQSDTIGPACLGRSIR